MLPLAIPLVSLVGGLLSSVVGSVVSQQMSRQSQQDQFDLNQQGIDTANRYNLPINQMSRLREAGLNPNLVYGNGSVPGITSSGEASTSQGLKTVPFDIGLSGAVDNYLKSKQIDQSVDESKTRQLLLAQQVRESMARENNYWLQGAFDRDTYYTRKHQVERYNTVMEKMLDKWSQDMEESGSRVRINEEKIKEIQANVDYLKARKGLTENQALTELCKPALIKSHINRNSKLNQLTDKQIEYYGELILIGHADWVRKDLQNYMDFERVSPAVSSSSYNTTSDPAGDLVNELIDAVLQVAAVSVRAL